MLEAWNALPDKYAWEANHEGMLETLKTVNEELKDASGEEDKKVGAKEYDVIGKTKSLKKSLSLQTEMSSMMCMEVGTKLLIDLRRVASVVRDG
jgi:hypothetical protein